MKKLEDQLEDLKIDIPKAPEYIEVIKKNLKEMGVDL
jgi:hypothetical protein